MVSLYLGSGLIAGDAAAVMAGDAVAVMAGDAVAVMVVDAGDAVMDRVTVAVFLEVVLTALLTVHETLVSSSLALGTFVLCNQLSSTVPSPSSRSYWNQST